MAKTHSCPFYNQVTIDQMKKAYQKKNYPFYVNHDYNINLFGIRNTDDKDSNAFNDLIGLLYKQDDKWKLLKFDATTDPGIYYRQNPMCDKGCGAMIPGYYKGLFQLGYHKGQYRSLVQKGNVASYRDNNKDSKIDFVGKDVGFFGCNLHRANEKYKSVQVDKWSAMCQVIADPADFASLLAVCEISAKAFGNSFSYALFLQKEIL